jgi:TolB protein
MHNEEPSKEQPRRNWGKGCLLIMVTGVVIISLLATSVASLIWFIGERTSSGGEPSITTFGMEEDELSSQVPEKDAPPSQTEIESTNADSDITAVTENQVNLIVLVNEERQIETISPDGSQRHLLTESDHFYEFPTWSPDGSQIATLGNDRNGGGIFLLPDVEESGQLQELYFSRNRRPFYLYWSPDGQQISFLANNPIHGIGLNVVDAEIGEESREIASGSPFYWNWAADSKQLLIHSGNQDDGSRLVLIDDDGQDQAPQIPAPGFFQAPGISPSGRYWAYSQIREGGVSWITVDDQSNGEQTTERHAGAIALNWSPAADQLAFISGNDDGQFNFWGPLRLLDMATGETRLMSSNLVLAFFWSPDGKQIFTISVPSFEGLDGEIEVRKTKSRHLARNRQAAPPMQRMPHRFMLSVINVEDGSGLELAEVSFSTTFLAQFLIYFDQYALSHSVWSPDSKQIVLPIVADGENRIVVISNNSGRMHQIGNGSIAFWSKQ